MPTDKYESHGGSLQTASIPNDAASEIRVTVAGGGGGPGGPDLADEPGGSSAGGTEVVVDLTINPGSDTIEFYVPAGGDGGIGEGENSEGGAGGDGYYTGGGGGRGGSDAGGGGGGGGAGALLRNGNLVVGAGGGGAGGGGGDDGIGGRGNRGPTDNLSSGTGSSGDSGGASFSSGDAGGGAGGAGWGSGAGGDADGNGGGAGDGGGSRVNQGTVVSTGKAEGDSEFYGNGHSVVGGGGRGFGGPGYVYIEYVLPPTTPQSLTHTADVGQITLNWDAVNWNGEQDTYNIYRNGGLLTTVSAGTTSYTDDGLGYGVTNTYSVSAENSAAESSQSNSATDQTFWPATIDGEQVQEITIDGTKATDGAIDGTFIK
jgi:hypothetical protein